MFMYVHVVEVLGAGLIREDGPVFCMPHMVPLQSLLGGIERQWVMGTISQVEDGRFCLEDLTASVPIDFSQAISSSLWIL
jgi:hypothetical protein